eukprot:PhM_4_TR16123/c0_g1_i1/m.101325
MSLPDDIKAHVANMERVVDEMQKLCDDQRQLLQPYKFGDVPPTPNQTPSLLVNDNGDAKEGSILRRRSSIDPPARDPDATLSPKPSDPLSSSMSSNSIINKVPRTLEQVPSDGGSKPRRRSSVEISEDDLNGTLSNTLSPRRQNTATTVVHGPDSRSVDKLTLSPSTSRLRMATARKEQAGIFESFTTPVLDQNSPIHCDHIGVLAVAFTYLLGGSRDDTDRKKRVTPEDIFFSTHLPLYYIANNGITLDELYDIAREFMEVDTRFQHGNFALEIVHMDPTLKTGEVQANATLNDMGERGPRMSLTDTRRMIHEEVHNPNTALVINYDPYIVEQALTVDSVSDDEDASPAFAAVLSPSMRKIQEQQKKGPVLKANLGGFALAMDFHPSAHNVSLGSVTIDQEMHLSRMEVPLGGLYKAMCAVNPYNSRARGYLKITNLGELDETLGTVNQNIDEDHDTEVGCMFSPELCSGKVMGSIVDGISLMAGFSEMAPHLTTAAYALHLMSGKRTGQYGRGICSSDIAHTLDLPTDVLLNTNDLHIDYVYSYLAEYVRRKGWNYTVDFTPVIQKVDRDDAASTMSISELLNALDSLRETNVSPDVPNTVLMVNFNPGVAHNILNLPPQSHWGVITGFDGDQHVRINDCLPKKYSSSWTVAVDRLHRAVTGYGFIALSRKDLDADVPAFTFGPKDATVVARVDQILPMCPHRSNSLLPRAFAHPAFATPLTPACIAMTRLGKPTSVGNMLMGLSKFDINFLLTRRISMHDLERVINKYALTSGADVSATATHYDIEKSKMAFHTFIVFVKEAVADQNRSVIFYFKRSAIACAPKNGGAYGVLVGFDESREVITLMDCNPDNYLSVWHVNQKTFFDACYSQKCNVSQRGRGYITVTRTPTVVPPGRAFELATVPVQHQFRSATAPAIRALSFALSELNEQHSPEEIFYAAFLKTLGENRRRGSAAFAWRDVDVSLYVLNEKLTPALTERLGRRFLESQKLTSLGIERVMELPSHQHFDEELRRCTDPTCPYVVLAVYDVNMIHKIKIRMMPVGVALIRHYDGERVWVSESDPSNFGEVWSCDAALFKEACGYGPGNTSDDSAFGGMAKDFGWLQIGNLS